MKYLMVRSSEKEIPQRSGIYAISCRHRRRIYIGSTYNFSDRFGKHLSKLIRKKHPNNRLQKLFEREQVLYFSVLKICPLFELPRLEHEYIQKYERTALNLVKKPSFYRRKK